MITSSLVGFAVLLTACGSDESAIPAMTAAVTTIAPATTAAPTTTRAPIPVNEIRVDMADFSYPDLPSTIPAGPTRFVVTNSGAEEHHLTMVRLEDGVAIGDALGAFATDPKSAYPLVTFFGGPQSVAPGDSQSAVVNLEPGSYAALCVIPSADGVPHAAKGMLKEFTVPEPAVAGDPVNPGDTIVLSDYRFDLPEQLPGKGTIRVKNDGNQPHEIAIYKVNDGADPADAVAFLSSETPPAGPPPFTAAGGITAMQSGQVVGVDLDLPPGNYVFICFLPDHEDNAPHFTKGMVQVVEIG